MSDSWVRDRMQAGEMPRPGETAEQYVEAYLEYRMSKVAAAKASGGDLNLDEERARLAKEQADRVAMDNAERRKELASLPAMTSAVASVVEVSLGRLMRVGAIVAQGDVALRERVDNAIRDALEELSATRIAELAGGSFDDGEEPEPGDD